MPGEPRGSGLGLDDRGSGGGAVALLRDVGVEGTGLVGVHEPLAVGSVGLGGVGADELVVAGADLEELDGAVQLAVLLGRVDVAEESALFGLDRDVALSGAGEGRNCQGAGNGEDGGDLCAAGLGGMVAHRVSFEFDWGRVVRLCDEPILPAEGGLSQASQGGTEALAGVVSLTPSGETSTARRAGRSRARRCRGEASPSRRPGAWHPRTARGRG